MPGPEAPRIFADTLFWGALIYPRDRYHNRAAEFARLRSDAHLFNIEEILAEFLDGLARRGRALRQSATRTVDAVLTNSEVTVHRQSHESFLAALELYQRQWDSAFDRLLKLQKSRLSEPNSDEPSF